MRKFIVNESCCQQLLVLAPRHKEPESGGERLSNLVVVPKANGDRRTVLDGGEFLGQLWTCNANDVSRPGRRQSDDYRIEVIRIQSSRNYPSTRFRLNCIYWSVPQ